MKTDPYDLRRRAFEGKNLGPHEIGRAIYHLAQRRHFGGNVPDGLAADPKYPAIGEDDRKAASARMETARTLEREEKILGPGWRAVDRMRASGASWRPGRSSRRSSTGSGCLSSRRQYEAPSGRQSFSRGPSSGA